MTVGERIKNRRLELGLTQDELAKKVGYKSRSSINKIELSRDLPLGKVQLVAVALETTPGYLMGWEDEDIQNAVDNTARNLTPSQIIEQVLEKTTDPLLRRIMAYYLLIADKIEGLNDTGKKKLLERLEELEQLPDCRKES